MAATVERPDSYRCLHIKRAIKEQWFISVPPEIIKCGYEPDSANGNAVNSTSCAGHCKSYYG